MPSRVISDLLDEIGVFAREVIRRPHVLSRQAKCVALLADLSDCKARAADLGVSLETATLIMRAATLTIDCPVAELVRWLGVLRHLEPYNATDAMAAADREMRQLYEKS